MKKTVLKITLYFYFCALPYFFTANLNAQTIQAESDINWITRNFTTNISLDTEKANLQMPSGKKRASASIKTKMTELIQPPLLSLFSDSEQNLSDLVVKNELLLDQVYTFIMNGQKTPDVFSTDIKKLNTTNVLNVDNLTKELIKHKFPYHPDEPIDVVPTRAYSGIVIDARGMFPVHGEYVKSDVKACFFPKIWDENMHPIYEKNSLLPQFAKSKSVVKYHYSDELSDYEDRAGGDPLYIRAVQVYGRNRTDPVISRKDALKILTQPDNVKLLEEGKVVILLDKPNLIYKIAVPEKTKSYYVKYEAVKQYFYENKIPVEVTDTAEGLRFSIQLNFFPDSEKLLPGETERLQAIAGELQDLMKEDGYTILVEGHTADVGKPVGQLNLSIDRTITVMNVLIDEGLDKSLFTYKGYGGTMPIDTNATEEGRANNRRVDITARPRATYIQKF